MEGKFRFTRRQFLVRLGAGLAAIGLSGFLAACQQFLERTNSGGAVGDATRTPAPMLVPKFVNGIPITPNEEFYTVWFSKGQTPLAPPDWKLKLVGLVDKPLEFSLEQLKAIPAVEEMRTLECISNPIGGELISNAIWKGVRLKDLLQQAGLKSGAKELKLESFDGFHTSIPVELGMHEQSLLVYEMNGVPLPRDHGAPLRCLWPGRYGMKQPKWLHTITVLASEHLGFWERQGWSNDAFILPNSRIDAPRDLAVISIPTFTLSGVAFSGEDGIDRLDISWDDSNAWSPAELTRGPSPFVWTIWTWTGPALPTGRHTLYARVTDKRGRQQTRSLRPSFLEDTFPNGTDKMHSVVLEFRS